MRRRRREILINVAPMADIVFLLLIFFMLAGAFLIEPGIKVKLPQTKTAEIHSEEKLTLTITHDQKIFLGKKEVKLEDLERELALALLRSKEKLLIVRADKSVPHGIVVEVLDTAKLAGVERLAIASEKK